MYMVANCKMWLLTVSWAKAHFCTTRVSIERAKAHFCTIQLLCICSVSASQRDVGEPLLLIRKLSRVPL